MLQNRNLMTLAILLLAFFSTSISVWAAGTPHPAVCRVVVEEQMGQAFGSGTLIDAREGYGLVVTNWHVVRDATGKIEVQFPSGFRSEAKPIKLDETWDLAALVIWRPPTEPVQLARQAPVVGDVLTIHGYGQGDYRQAWGRCTDYYSPTQGMPQELVELNVEARQGDSGGPIFNAQGQMAGVLFGAGQGTTLGSFGGRVDQFLATLGEGIGKGTIAPQTVLANVERLPIVNQFSPFSANESPLVNRFEPQAPANVVAATSAAAIDPFLAADLRAKETSDPRQNQFAKYSPSQIDEARIAAWPSSKVGEQPAVNRQEPIAVVASIPGPTKKTAAHTLAVPELPIAAGSWGPTVPKAIATTTSVLASSATAEESFTIVQVPTPSGIDLAEEGRTILALVGLIALAVQGVRATAS